MLLVHLFVLYVLVFVIFLFLLVSGVGCSLSLWNSLDFSINFLIDGSLPMMCDVCNQQINGLFR